MVFPVILITAGVVFLLNNLGLLGWDVWTFLWRLWPVLLIGAGLDFLIGRRSRWGSLVVAGLLLAVLGGSVWYAATTMRSPTGTVTDRDKTLHAPLGGAARAEVDIRASVGVMQIESTDDALVDGHIALHMGEQVRESHEVKGDTAYYSLRSEIARSIPILDGRSDSKWDVRLTDRIPLKLRLATGVGKSEIRLTELQVTDLKLETGVGKTTVWLPKQGRAKADIDVGVGEVNIYLPEGVAARIRVKTGIGNIEVSGDFHKDGSLYTSPGYDSAEHRIELDVNGGIGKVNIEQE